MKRLLMVTTDSLGLLRKAAPIATSLRLRGWVIDGMAAGATACMDSLRMFDHLWEAPWRMSGAHRGHLLAPARVAEIVLHHDYDVVHVRSSRAAWYTRLGLRNLENLSATRLVYTLDGPLNGLAERFTRRWTDDVIATTSHDHFKAIHLGLVPPERLHFLPDLAANQISNRRIIQGLEQIYQQAIASHHQKRPAGRPHRPLFRMIQGTIA